MTRHQKAVIGSIWRFEHWRRGVLLAERLRENICPDEYINYLLSAGMASGAQVANWYIALFSDNYTPLITDTYAVPGFTESTAYDEAYRPVWSHGGVSAKSMSNTASKASFTMTGVDTAIYGAALVSVSTKGDTAGGGLLGPVAQITEGPFTGIIANDEILIYVTINGASD